MASIWFAGSVFSACVDVYWFIELLTLERYYQSVTLLIAIPVASFIIVCAYTNFMLISIRHMRHVLHYNYGGCWHFILLFSMFYWFNQCYTGNSIDNKHDNIAQYVRIRVTSIRIRIVIRRVLVDIAFRSYTKLTIRNCTYTESFRTPSWIAPLAAQQRTLE